jgi:hypothetical protein
MNKLGGRVHSITTDRNGEVTVVIDSTATGGVPPEGKEGPLLNYFYSKNFTDEILAEFKRAQNHSLAVHIEFNDDRTITSITVL